jgi:hypothetical protein
MNCKFDHLAKGLAQVCKRRHALTKFGAGLAGMAFTCSVTAQTYDLTADFSSNENPNGPWSYRYKPGTTRDGDYYLLPAYGPADGSWSPVNPGSWSQFGNGGVPLVGVNQTGSDVTYASPAFVWPNGTMHVHPGNLDLVIVSWLSASTSHLNINFSFSSLNPTCGNGIEWYVEMNNSTNTLSSGSYSSGGTSGPITLTGIPVGPGDRINFIVDPNGDYGCDSTLVTATIDAHTAQTYDVAVDFSAVSNPNGPWSYGYSTNLGSPLTLYTNMLNESGLNLWLYNIASTDPNVHQNPTSNAISITSAQIPPGGFGLHPGPDGEYSVARLTVPQSGLYRVTGTFFGEDNGGGAPGVSTTTDVHVLTNGVSVTDGEVTGFGPGTGPSFDILLQLNLGDYLDFAVGYGTDGNYGNDSTGLSAQIIGLTPPMILVQPSSQTVLVGGTVTFSVGVTGPTPLSYQWLFNGTNLPGSINPTLTLTNLSPSQSGVYAVLVTNNFGTALSSNALLTVVPPSLQISPGYGVVLLSWPTNASGFVLETSEGVGTNQTWNTFPGPVYIFTDQNVVAANAANRSQFFRLHKP